MSESPTDFKTIGLLGSGTASANIAFIFASNGHEVIVLETGQDDLHSGPESVIAPPDNVSASDQIESDTSAIYGRITVTNAATDLAMVDVVLQSATEDAATTKALVSEIATIVGEQTPILINTGALSVTDIAAALPHPGRIAGLHFLTTAPTTRTVEVVRALQTDDELVDRLVDLVDTLEGKTPAIVKDRPGFLINALVLPFLNDVIQEYDDGLASAEDIDIALELGLGYKTGPLRMLDTIGLDAHLRVTEAVHAATSDARYAPPPLLRQMVAAGQLGYKAGHGFRINPTHPGE